MSNDRSNWNTRLQRRMNNGLAEEPTYTVDTSVRLYWQPPTTECKRFRSLWTADWSSLRTNHSWNLHWHSEVSMVLMYRMNCKTPRWREISAMIHSRSVDRHYQKYSSTMKSTHSYSYAPGSMLDTHWTGRCLCNETGLQRTSYDGWKVSFLFSPESNIDSRIEARRCGVSSCRTSSALDFIVGDRLIITNLQTRIIDRCRSIRALH